MVYNFTKRSNKTKQEVKQEPIVTMKKIEPMPADQEVIDKAEQDAKSLFARFKDYWFKIRPMILAGSFFLGVVAGRYEEISEALKPSLDAYFITEDEAKDFVKNEQLDAVKQELLQKIDSIKVEPGEPVDLSEIERQLSILAQVDNQQNQNIDSLVQQVNSILENKQDFQQNLDDLKALLQEAVRAEPYNGLKVE